MFERLNLLGRLRALTAAHFDRLRAIGAALVCHRAIYAALSACHGSGCVITDKPELYGPMAVLYAILAVRG